MADEPAYVATMREELKQLQEHNHALHIFQGTDEHTELPPEDRTLLLSQSLTMREYERILKQRIDRATLA